MTIDSHSTYRPPLFLGNAHFQTVYPTLFRKFDTGFYRRERISTNDDDFLDLDWSPIGSDRLGIVSHGLEGNSHRAYVVGMVKALNKTGWDALAWNYRGCSGEPNRQLRFYHNGAIDDLALVIDHALRKGNYKSVALIGFSLGGNLSLVYLGQQDSSTNPLVQKAVVFSVPCDLHSSAIALEMPKNRVYMNRFLKLLHQKIKAKKEILPHLIDDKDYHMLKTFKHFDDRYTAPIHGFKDALDYWAKCSSKQFIPNIRIPTLIVNAKNDPFLTESCFPIDDVSMNENVHMEMPQSGGHVGFVSFNKEKTYWSEKRAMQFLGDGY